MSINNIKLIINNFVIDIYKRQFINIIFDKCIYGYTRISKSLKAFVI